MSVLITLALLSFFVYVLPRLKTVILFSLGFIGRYLDFVIKFIQIDIEFWLLLMFVAVFSFCYSSCLLLFIFAKLLDFLQL